MGKTKNDMLTVIQSHYKILTKILDYSTCVLTGFEYLPLLITLTQEILL